MEDFYIQRCFELARLAAGNVSPNPNVGAVIVKDERIIGEGWHQEYGSAHAEINALKDVKSRSSTSLDNSKIYVSLEPCCIHGNTPPCTQAIISHGIRNVGISAEDMTDGVKDISKKILDENNVSVNTGILKKQGELLVAPRNTLMQYGRPYIVLKWAQSSDGYMGRENERTRISNTMTQRYVHKLRAQSDAILVGRKTIEVDNPALTTRYFSGDSPQIVLIGSDLELNENLQILKNEKPPILFTTGTLNPLDGVQIVKVERIIEDTLLHLGKMKFTTLLVEGGSQTLNAFIKKGMWDEIQCITNIKQLSKGVSAPDIPTNTELSQSFQILDDRVEVYIKDQRN